jgi:MFS family permease
VTADGPRPFSFPRLFAGAWLGYTTYAVLLAVLPLAELSEGGGPLLATLVIGAPLLTQTLTSWGWGWVADRTGARRGPLSLAMAAQTPLFALFPVLTAPELFVVRLLQSAFFGAVVLATTQATEDPLASSAIRLGRLQIATSGGMLAGILVALPLLLQPNFRLGSVGGWELSALLAVLTALSAIFFAAAGELPRPSVSPGRRPLGPSYTPELLRLGGATVAVSTIRYIPVTAIPVFLAAGLGADGFFGIPMNVTAQLAIWLGVASALSLLAAPLSGRLAVRAGSRRRGMLAIAIVYAAAWTVLFLFPFYPVTFGIWVFPLSVFLVVATVQEAASLSSREYRGRAVGLVSASFNLGGLLGGAIAGILLLLGAGIGLVFLVAAVGGCAAAGLFLPRVIRLPYTAAGPRTSGS